MTFDELADNVLLWFIFVTMVMMIIIIIIIHPVFYSLGSLKHERSSVCAVRGRQAVV